MTFEQSLERVQLDLLYKFRVAVAKDAAEKEELLQLITLFEKFYPCLVKT